MTATNDSLKVGDRAPDFSLSDHAGVQHELAEMCRDRPLAIFFERHLGCPFCHDHVMNVKLDYDRIRAAGGDATVIVMGGQDQAAGFKERHDLPFVCLSDPNKVAYSAFEAPRGNFWSVAGPKIWIAGLRAILRGGAGKIGDDVHQLQSSFVVDQQQIIRYVHRAKTSADYPDHDQIIATIESLTGASAAQA